MCPDRVSSRRRFELRVGTQVTPSPLQSSKKRDRSVACELELVDARNRRIEATVRKSVFLEGACVTG